MLMKKSPQTICSQIAWFTILFFQFSGPAPCTTSATDVNDTTLDSLMFMKFSKVALLLC